MDLRKPTLLLMHRLRMHTAAAGSRQVLGVIFSAHRVQPARGIQFQPNLALTITPEFLEAAILKVRAMGLETVSLDDAHERMSGDAGGKAERQPFACFTFDDGYRDNRIWGFPVLARHGVPHTIYVPAAFAGGKGVLWWELLERIIAGRDRIACEGMGNINAATATEKFRAFAELARRINGMHPREAHRFIVGMAARHGIDSDAVCRELMMGWDELAEFRREKLLAIGGHTANHYRLAKLTADDAESEIERGLAGLKDRLGIRPGHFSYPFGDSSSAGEREFEIARRLGLKTAVTTTSGFVHAGNRNRMTSLPRLSLNRVYNDVRCLEVLVSGAPWALRTLATGAR